MSLAAITTGDLQRVVLPDADTLAGLPGGAPAVLPLYVEGAAAPEHVRGRAGYLVPRGTTASFATYFNAFPAGHWARWTDVDEVVLRVDLAGPGTVRVHRSDADGHAGEVATRVGDGTAQLEVRVRLDGFDDGGWLWFDVGAGDHDVLMRSACWGTHGAGRPLPALSVGITTYNRVDSCLGVLRGLGRDPGVLEHLDTVYLVDQGERRVARSDGFAAATAPLGGRLRVLEQDNLGGSGGFARAQLETLRAGTSEHLVILDDDIVLEPESLRRAAAFAEHCRTPTLVGAHMLSLPEPTRLYSLAERVDLRSFRWGPAHPGRVDHDLAADGLRSAGWLHRREDVNYSGWWMCLLPRRVLEEVGLSLPFFIRWDDAEFGLRAGAEGFPTVTLPGTAVWHVPWSHKTDALDWQAYFHHRNRLVAALLHSPYRHGGRLVPELLLHQVKQLASMQYSTAELRLLAVDDVLEGPAALHPGLPVKAAAARATQRGFADADVRDPAELPAAVRRTPSEGRSRPGRASRWAVAVSGVARQVLPTGRASRRTPQVHLRAGEAHWSTLLKYDSAVVSTADGGGAVWYRRDRAVFARIARRSLVAHWRLVRGWPRLAAQYRGSLAEIASPARWEQTFDSVRKGPTR